MNLSLVPNIEKTAWSINCLKATQPVPGNDTLAAKLMARAWKSSNELQTATIMNVPALSLQP